MATRSEGHSTVDIEDVKRHAKQAKDWWSPNGGMRLLHRYNSVRVPFIRNSLVPPATDVGKMEPLSNISILDVGCGGGILTEALAKIGAKMTGIDASGELIEVAKIHSSIDTKISNNRPTYYCTTVEEHSEHFQNHYDAVVASEIIEHVTDKELFVKSCVNALKPGGKIFFTTPTRTRFTQFFSLFIGEFILQLVPRGTHQYDKLVTPDELKSLLEKNNCRVESVGGVSYNILSRRFSVTSSPHFLFTMKAVKCEI